MRSVESDETGFTSHTLRWQRNVSEDKRKQLGQYMTPAGLRRELLDRCDLTAGMRVLDPGTGTGELLKETVEREPDAVVHGWDVDRDVLSTAAAVVPKAVLTRRSALKEWQGKPFDLVVGNPPYCQYKPGIEVRKRFREVISGRANLFALFFQAGLDVLKPDGQLAYIVPPSMNSGAYFEGLRSYLTGRASVEYLKVYTNRNLFDRAQTPVQVIVLRRGRADPGRHVFVVEDKPAGFRRTVLTENAAALRSLFCGSVSLYRLGYETVTGSVAWNQHRGRLRRFSERGTVPLVWAHNIRDEGLRLQPEHIKPQFVVVDGLRPLLGPAVVVNRIIGPVGDPTVRFAMVPAGMSFLGENHVNVIRRREGAAAEVGWDGLLEVLRLSNLEGCLRLLAGNTQVSAAELTHLLPLRTSAV